MFKRLLSLILTCTLIVACSEAVDSKHVLKVGTIAGPETELMETAKRLARDRYQLDIQIIQFSDYILPNVALNDGSIDVNIYQHLPYLDTAKKLHNYKFISIGKTFIYPMALYSKKHQDLSSIGKKAVIAIPNDPSNSARALLLLEDAGLIKLKNHQPTQISPADISYNPMDFQIKELDAAQLPRVLSDVDIAAINTNYAVDAGLLPKRDSLFLEKADSPYANIIVIRAADKDDERFKMLLDVMHSREVIGHAKKLFQEQAIPAW